MCVVRYAQITQNNTFRGIEFLRFHKMTKIWTPPPSLFGTPPPLPPLLRTFKSLHQPSPPPSPPTNYKNIKV